MSGRASFMNFIRFLDVFFLQLWPVFSQRRLHSLAEDFWEPHLCLDFVRQAMPAWSRSVCTASLISSCEMEVKCCCKGDVCPFIGNPSDTVCQYDSMIFYIQGLFCMLHGWHMLKCRMKVGAKVTFTLVYVSICLQLKGNRICRTLYKADQKSWNVAV